MKIKFGAGINPEEGGHVKGEVDMEKDDILGFAALVLLLGTTIAVTSIYSRNRVSTSASLEFAKIGKLALSRKGRFLR